MFDPPQIKNKKVGAIHRAKAIVGWKFAPQKKKTNFKNKSKSLNVVMVTLQKPHMITWKMDDMFLGFEVIFSGRYVGGEDSVTVMLNQFGSQK